MTSTHAMDLYEVSITGKAESQLTRYTDYIVFTLKNPIAARNLLDDVCETQGQLAAAAGSLPLCRHPVLQKYGYRSINLLRHNYVMLYRIHDNCASVEAIYHQRQDYENIFAHESKLY